MKKKSAVSAALLCAGLMRCAAALADMADTVCELVCGIPIVLKGALPE